MVEIPSEYQLQPGDPHSEIEIGDYALNITGKRMVELAGMVGVVFAPVIGIPVLTAAFIHEAALPQDKPVSNISIEPYQLADESI